MSPSSSSLPSYKVVVVVVVVVAVGRHAFQAPFFQYDRTSACTQCTKRLASASASVTVASRNVRHYPTLLVLTWLQLVAAVVVVGGGGAVAVFVR